MLPSNHRWYLKDTATERFLVAFTSTWDMWDADRDLAYPFASHADAIATLVNRYGNSRAIRVVDYAETRADDMMDANPERVSSVEERKAFFFARRMADPLYQAWLAAKRAGLQRWTLKAACAALALMIALPSNVEARRHHRHHHHHRPHWTAHAQKHHAKRAPVVAVGSSFADRFAPPNPFSIFSSGAPQLVSLARQFIGTNPTRQSSLWCQDFVNFVLGRAGKRGTGSRLAMSSLKYQHVSNPQPGDLAVMGRRGGGHVGIVSGFDRAGNPILVSGNSGGHHGRRTVTEHAYPRSRIIAFTRPS